MKLNGIFGKGSGKVGESVWAVSGGVQIVRPYNPNVTNPQTPAQVQQRAKFKLMSQLAAALAPAIAFKKQGLVSARNQFVSANLGLCTFSEGKADVVLTNLDLTGGNRSFPAVVAGTVTQAGLPVHIEAGVSADIKAVVYAVASYESGGKIELLDIKVVTQAGENNSFPATMRTTADAACVFAYGIVGDSANGTINYDEYTCNSDPSSAQLIVLQKAILAGGTFTKTTTTELEL